MREASQENRIDTECATKISRELIDWYWKEGCQRGERPADSGDWQGNYEQFALPTGTWLRQLYQVRDGLETVQAAASTPRPSVALWGMSQTGKSTSVSALIDAKVQVAPIPAEPDKVVSPEQVARDGVDGGLHWEGGLPYFFVAPFRDTERGEKYPMHWYDRSLNPFNSGLDASSCLSRFVPGSRSPQPGRNHISDPLHPTQVHFVPPSDLLHALARGFDSECLGPALKGKQTEWTPDRFDRMLAEFRDKHRSAGASPPNRLAYERMLAVVTTLDDLVFGRVETFAKLRTTDADWQSRLESLLADNILVSDPQIADEFAALLFWNSSGVFTERYHAMRALYDALMKVWAGKPVYATLPVTSLLLDMQSCVNAFPPKDGRDDPTTREGKQRQLIRSMGYKIAGSRVLLGCGPEYPQKLGQGAEQYCNLQGLVWELVIPINLDNLLAGPFRDLLAASDLLDFPGVGRDEKNETNRLNAHPALFPAASPDQACTAQRFYSDIVKRGKTASIVATYSRRLTVDSFSILQNIDKDEPSNHATDQLTNGIRTWLRNMAPGFTEGAGQPPEGVSLNLGLTFWGEFVDQSKPDRATNFEMRRKFYGKLGVISDPAVSTIFALNYHWIRSPRVKFTQPFKRGADLYERVVGESEFQRMFRNPVSLESLQVMTEDLERGGSGGADYMFGKLREQATARSGPERALRFSPVAQRMCTTLATLLAWRHLRPPHGENDTRLEEIDAFIERLHGAIEGRGERDVRMTSHALREMLNVDPEGISLPANGSDGLSSAFVDKLFTEWKNRQVQRYDEALRSGGLLGEPEWPRLGVRGREDLDRMLEALITSLPREVAEEVATLARRCWDTIPGRDEHRQQHLRRYLAFEMTNRMLYKSPEKRTVVAQAAPTAGARIGPAPTGKATPAYAAFIGPFIERQLGAIKRHLTPVVLRPPLHGDSLLEAILQSA
jgi:hypothetical protein